MKRLIATGLGLALAGPALAGPVGYEVGGEAFEGYFAAAEAPRGLVVIVHDWDGVGDYEVRRADMLAELGYDAFAVDVFGAGNRPDTNEGRMAAMQAAFADPERLMALVEGGLAVAREAERGRGDGGHGLLLRRHGDAGRGAVGDRGGRRLRDLPRQLPRGAGLAGRHAAAARHAWRGRPDAGHGASSRPSPARSRRRG